MKQEIKEKWIKALTDGSYRQGLRCLQSGAGEFCCLGVLTDLYHKETGVGNWCDPITIGNQIVRDFIDENGGSHTSELPSDVQDWSGLDNWDILDVLMIMNDGKTDLHNNELFPSCSFVTIADYIKEHL